MNHKINAGLAAIVSLMVLAILPAFVSSAIAFAPGAESYLGGSPGHPQSGTDAAGIETAQAAQSQTFQPGSVPQAPSQGAPRQTLTLPQVVPQPQLPPAAGGNSQVRAARICGSCPNVERKALLYRISTYRH